MTVRLERSEAIATIVLDRPARRNALTTDMLIELCRLADTLADDVSVRAIVVRGEGSSFCAGADLSEFSTVDSAIALQRWTPLGQRAFERLSTLPTPSIAVINGSAVGGGLELALAATFRVIGTDGIVWMPEVSIGTLPGWSGLRRLPGLIGAQRSRRMLLLEEHVTAQTALAWGLVDRVADDPLTAAYELAGALARRPRTAVQLAVAALADSPTSHLDLVERLAAATTAGSPEVRCTTAIFGPT